MAWKSVWRGRGSSYYDRASQRRVVRSRLLVRIAKLGLLAVVGLFIFSFVVLPLLAFNLPSPDKIVRREGFSTKILDRDGKLLYDIFADQRRTPVSLSEVPLYLRQATVAIEDKNFYKHQGFDPTGILRALINTILRGRLQGGSTLTQQLVKNVLLSSERTILRKVREFVLAVQIERRYSKDEILQMYLNEAPYGGTAWGVATGSEVYFGKKVSDLNLVESAVLAGFPQKPSFYSPYSSNPKAYIERTTQVLRRMTEDGYITKGLESEAQKELEKVQFLSRGAGFKAPHFVQYVQGILEERYGQKVVEQGGLKVTTTLDLDLQEKAQGFVAEEIAKVESLNITNGAAVVVDVNTGEILAMVGSKNFDDPDYDGQVNVTLSLRQPGSAIKPVTYLTALKKGYTASTLLMDTQTTFPGGVGQPDYKPVNYDGKFRGPLQVRFALANSVNTPAVKMLARVGINDTLQTAYELGISTLEPNKETLSRVGLSLTLGGGEVRLLELTSAYQAFANGGTRQDPIAILKVEDQNGKVLEETKIEKGKTVITAEQAFIISHILSDNEARAEVFGTRSALVVPGRTVAVKTGTTNDSRDNWTIGWTPNQVVVGVWVGNNDNSAMKQVASGVTGAAPIWRRILQEAVKGKPAVAFAAPPDIVTAAVDTVSGYAAHDGYPSRIEYFIRGTEPTSEDPVHTKLKICKTDGKLATPADVLSGNYDEKEFFVFKEEDPTTSNVAGSINRWQEGILSWLSTEPDPRYHPPEDYCGSGNPVVVSFKSPKDRETVASTFDVRVDPVSTSKIVQVEIELDNAKVATLSSSPFVVTLSGADGQHTIRAKAKDEKGNEGSSEIKIGVNAPWATSTPTPQT